MNAAFRSKRRNAGLMRQRPGTRDGVEILFFGFNEEVVQEIVKRPLLGGSRLVGIGRGIGVGRGVAAQEPTETLQQVAGFVWRLARGIGIGAGCACESAKALDYIPSRATDTREGPANALGCQTQKSEFVHLRLGITDSSDFSYEIGQLGVRSVCGSAGWDEVDSARDRIAQRDAHRDVYSGIR